VDVAGFEPVSSLSSLAVGSLAAVVLSSGQKVCLVRTAAGVCALADRCSHRDFPLSAGDVTADGLVECAWHGAQFDPTSGAMLIGPGGDDIPTFAVRIDGDTISVGPRRVDA
jgi:3-phenylpropionate/trans-cinnamate dioxygenase ferredoxin component